MFCLVVFCFFFPEIRAGKFLAVNRCCFGLLHYSAKGTAAPRVCVPPVAESASLTAAIASSSSRCFLKQLYGARSLSRLRTTPQIKPVMLHQSCSLLSDLRLKRK